MVYFHSRKKEENLVLCLWQPRDSSSRGRPQVPELLHAFQNCA